MSSYGPVQNDPVWHGPVWCFIQNLRQPYMFMCHLGGGLIFHLGIYGILAGGEKKAVTPVCTSARVIKQKSKLSKFCLCQAYPWFENLEASP